MAEDKWFKLYNDEMDDIPARIEQMKSKYWKDVGILIAFAVVGSVVMAFGPAIQLTAMGCFIAVTGVVGMFALATMYHAQLCLYRAIKEIRKTREDAGPVSVD